MLLALFLERLSILISSSTVEVDVSHIAGKSSDVADALSQWDHKGDPPCNCLLADRFPITPPLTKLIQVDRWLPN
jgi:hypothetical protein